MGVLRQFRISNVHEEDFQTMLKRILALLLSSVLLISCLAACSNSNDDEEDLGPYITMYLTDEVYDFDPANAYYNTDTANIVGMMFDTLFKLSANGKKVEKSLVKSYTINENKADGEYTMELKLKETYWSNGTRLQAQDVLYAWQRLLRSTNSFEAASLLFDIKNARLAKEGGTTDIGIDDIGVEAVGADVLKITFEGPIDYDQFLLNLTSVATAPLLESYVEKNADWAKKSSTIVTSGPYKLGRINYEKVGDVESIYDDNAYLYDKNTKQWYYNYTDSEIADAADKGLTLNPVYWEKKINYFYLERNSYYYRDVERDKIDSSVKGYRLLVDCSKTEQEILDAYKNEQIFYVGSIPLSLRKDAYVQEYAKVSNSLSTFIMALNEEALISDGAEGTKLFADAKVRQALSYAIDREAIANEIVYADAATGLVAPGVFEAGVKSGDFREEGGALSTVATDLTKSRQLLTEAGITNPSKYSFTIKVPSYDDVNIKIAEMVAAAWNALGFNVTLQTMTIIQNNDYYKEVDSVPADVCDDLFVESIQRKTYEVIAYDYKAISADAYSVLSNFAVSFSGMAIDEETYELTANRTGYNSTAYNNLMEAIYYVPYFASLTRDSSDFLGIYETKEEYQTLYDAIAAIYAENGITPSTKSSDWTKQKAILLHKAEELLMTDMPVIPVVFTKNAVLLSKEVKNAEAEYYIPYTFRNATLKNYDQYYYTVTIGTGENTKEKRINIFESFPAVEWSKIGK